MMTPQMLPIARSLIRCAAMLASPDHRARWREEWLAEFGAIARTRPGAAWRFALGAPVDALSTRPPLKLFSAAAGDAKYALRQLLRRPSHTAAVIACLVVGLVASVATFSVISSVMYGDLVGISGRQTLSEVQLAYDRSSERNTGPAERARMSFNDFSVFREGPFGSAVESIGAEVRLRLTATGEHGAVSTGSAFASGDLFRSLRTRPAAGRLLAHDDDRADGARVVVISDYFWQTQLDSRPDAIGRTIFVSGMPYTVIGVTPARFHGLRPEVGAPDSEGPQLWLPLAQLASFPAHPGLDDRFIDVVARTRAGVKQADVERELGLAAARVAASNPARAHAAARVSAFGMAGPSDTPAEVLAIMAAVMSIPLVVLAIGCANVANLQLARVAEQSRELAIRLSLGATRTQLLRLLTAEALARVLAAIGLSLGLISLAIRWVRPLFPILIALDWRVFLFAASLAAGVALTTGMAPAWLVLRHSASGQLKQSAQSGGLGHSRLRGSLVVAQVALSLGLLVMTGLFARTIDAIAAPAALREQMVATFDPSELKMTPDEASRFATTLAARAAADSRVQHVSLSTSETVRYGVASASPGSDRAIDLVGASASWNDVMGLKLLAGRALVDSDDGSTGVVSRRAAEDIAPGGSALGAMLRIHAPAGEREAAVPDRQVRVVGIVDDNPLRPSSDRPDPVIYVPFPKALDGAFTMRVRTRQPDALESELRTIISQIDPRIAWTSLRSGDRDFEQDSKEIGYIASAIGISGLIALVMSATGLYAVMSYVVTLRRREIGVRLAIGAPPRRILSLMLRQSMRLVLAGVACGLVLAVPLAYWLRAMVVIEANPDPMAFLPTMLLLIAVGAIAAATPALRASRIDPIETLRQD